MTTFLLIIIALLAATSGVLYFLKKRAEDACKVACEATDLERQKRDEDVARVRQESRAALITANQSYESKLAELQDYANRIREHYEMEARRSAEEAARRVDLLTAEFEPLRSFASYRDAELEVGKALSDAMAEATALRDEAQKLIDQAHDMAAEERRAAQRRAKEMRTAAENVLEQATKEAGRIVAEAEKRAEGIAGDAYVALRDKRALEDAVGALWNTVNGYGDRYVIPTRSLLDDLAKDFGHTEAGASLATARDQSRRLVELGHAATCNYEEADRRDRANRFIIDAFNGRVDAILTRVKHDNYGTLEQEISDAFSVVNLNGMVFRDARIFPVYLDARLAELKWAAIVQELRLKAREEQRRIQEQIREEEKVRREQERAIRDAQEKQEAIQQALVKMRQEADEASQEERARYDAQIAELSARLEEAEAAKQREISLAQLTRAGNVYIISNIGSFGEEVFKIGMTRRRDPMDRIWELSDASVPFDFDVHAMIYTEDAPALEGLLHEAFDDLRVNQVNYRKEFFRLPLESIRNVAAKHGLNVEFTMAADAREYRETLALGKMTADERVKYHLREKAALEASME